MTERTRGLLILLSAAAIVGAYLGLRQKPKTTELPVLPSASAPSAPSVSPPRRVTVAEIDATLKALGGAVRAPAGDPASPWALAHGMVAFGSDFSARDGRSARDVIVGFAEPTTIGTDQLFLFPVTKAANPVEPHRFLLVKTLLETDVPMEQRFVASSGDKLTLARLVADLRKAAKAPESDSDYQHVAWQISALAEHVRREPKALDTPPPLGPLLALGLARLEADHKVVEEYSGPPEHAFDEGSPLHRAKRDKSGIYGHSCGGLHLVQAIASAVKVAGTDDQKRRFRRQLGVLLYRYELERPAYASLLLRHPEQGLLIRLQQQKFFGHLVETLTLAKKLGLTEPETEGGKNVDRVIFFAAADTVDVAKGLLDGGVYERLDAIRKDREQTYLDLVGDACHALRGLTRARELL
ncbi:MAG: hypothetical protein U0263_17780 [Polyangiaceae bacterium]